MKLTIVTFDWLKRLAAPLVMVFAVMFAAGPIADGLICGSTDEPAAIQGAFADTDHDAPSTPDLGGHAVCSHGHCHHASSAVPDDASADSEPTLALSAPRLAAGLSPSSAHLSGLERPPRV